MIGYTTHGTNDLEKAVAFYDALFADLDVKQMVPNERIVLWSKKPGGAMLAVAKPFDGEAASVGNGTMVALSVDSAETVATLHAKALELGASDEGAPRGSAAAPACTSAIFATWTATSWPSSRRPHRPLAREMQARAPVVDALIRLRVNRRSSRG